MMANKVRVYLANYGEICINIRLRMVKLNI